MESSGRWPAVVALLAMVMAACDIGPIAPEDRRIGADGGTVSLRDGSVTLLIPAGALNEELWFTAIPTASVPDLPLRVPNTTYELGPPGTTFSRPATLTVSYDPTQLPEGVGEGGLGLFQVIGGSWVLLDYAATDPTSNKVSGGTFSLGRFGVAGVALVAIEVTPISDTVAPGAMVRVNAELKGQDGRTLTARPVSWSSSDGAVATVDSTGLVTGLEEGTATITAASGGQSATAEIAVRIPVASVEVSPASRKLKVEETLQLIGTAKGVAGDTLPGRATSWSSSDAGVVTVTPSGLVQAVAVGSATVTANIEGKVGSATLSVHQELSVTTTTLTQGVVGIAYSQILAASGGNGSYEWALASGALPAGLALDATTGGISGTPTSAGTSTFSVQLLSGGQTALRTLALTVYPVPVASVEVTPSTAALAVGDSVLLSATPKDGSGNLLSGRTASWTSSDADVATVSSGGLVVGKRLGSVTIVATIEGFPDWAIITVSNRLTLTDSTLADGVVGMAYADTLVATGGDRGYDWSITADSLPAGLSLNDSTGVVSGTPTAAATRNLTVQVMSGDGQVVSRAVTLIIRPGLSISSTALAGGVERISYSDTLAATGGKTPYTWSISAGSLPAGLVIDASTGVISGSPTAAGTSSFTVKAESADNQMATKALSIGVGPAAVASVVVSPGNSTATLGQTRQLSATPKDIGGVSLSGRILVWTSASPGVATVNPNALVTGVSVGTTTITATVEGVSGTAVITVHALLGVSTSGLAGGTTGVAYNQTLAATGGDGTYVWTLSAGALPAGLSLDGATGVLSGIPAGAGSSSFTVQVTSGDGQVATRALTITVS